MVRVIERSEDAVTDFEDAKACRQPSKAEKSKKMALQKKYSPANTLILVQQDLL